MATGADTVARLQFVESQRAYIESQARMIRRAPIKYPELVSVESAASEFADVITYYSWDGTGRMEYMANRGNDYPLVNVQQEQHNVRIEWPALAYDWSIREIGAAMRSGVPLQDRKVMAAFSIWERHKDAVFMTGHSDFGWDGLINYSGITPEAAGGNWSGRTGLQVVDDINTILGAVYEDTNEVRFANTLLLPLAQRRLINTMPLGDNADHTVEMFIKDNNIATAETGEPLMIRGVNQLSTAGASNVARAIAYDRNREVLRFHVPMELNFLEPQMMGGQVIYYGHAALGGLEIMEPTAVKYMDGI